MLWYTNFTKSVAANSTDGPEALTTPSGKTRHYRIGLVHKLAGLTIKIYRDQELVVDVDVSNAVFDNRPLEIDMTVESGRLFVVKWANSTGGALVGNISVGYDEE